MMRAATALIAFFSVLSAPLASAVCTDCCNRSVEHQLPLCHDKAHTQLGPHVHHMNHVHMVTQDSDASAVIQQCAHRLLESRLSCQGSTCVSAGPVHAFVAFPPAPQLQILPHLLATPTCGSLLISSPGRPPDICRMAMDSSPFASPPLRI
jgi:hypothetical protein